MDSGLAPLPLGMGATTPMRPGLNALSLLRLAADKAESTLTDGAGSIIRRSVRNRDHVYQPVVQDALLSDAFARHADRNAVLEGDLLRRLIDRRFKRVEGRIDFRTFAFDLGARGVPEFVAASLRAAGALPKIVGAPVDRFLEVGSWPPRPSITRRPDASRALRVTRRSARSRPAAGARPTRQASRRTRQPSWFRSSCRRRPRRDCTP